MTDQSIIWRRLDRPGHEAVRLYAERNIWRLLGTAIFADEQPACLHYAIACRANWQTRSVSISGWVGETTVHVAIAVDTQQRWWLNGVEQPQVAGCLDIDLSFSPVTNLLPIRRLALANGQSAPVTAAWLRFPGFTLEPLDQRYRRLSDSAYAYESAGGTFRTALQVNDNSFVTHYPNLWQVEIP
ncbi:MAG: hypothetical protein DYG89_09975 [Caldilinea sp. CFX5]|nr:hypothetical protein [Caldilinea sp. CFX5]